MGTPGKLSAFCVLGVKMNARPCKYPRCCNTTRERNGYCADHQDKAPIPKQTRKPDSRPSAAQRGYGPKWKRIREQVLRSYGIPEDQWNLYDVDHRPRYNPDVEPDHWKYHLVPMLHGDHSRKTARCDKGKGGLNPWV
jgi:hypothetical protein